jgi:mRNA interferase HigB
MRIISRKTLKESRESKGRQDAEQPLKAWFAEASTATWSKMADIKERYPHASIVDRERVVFNIGGNKYRLAVKVYFPARALFIKFVGTHADYYAIDVTSL